MHPSEKKTITSMNAADQLSKADTDERESEITLAAASQIHLLNNPLYADVNFIFTTMQKIYGHKCFFNFRCPTVLSPISKGPPKKKKEYL